MDSFSSRPPFVLPTARSRGVYRMRSGSVDNGVTMLNPSDPPAQNEPKFAVSDAITIPCDNWSRRSPLAAMAVALVALVALVAPALAQQAARISGVTVQFDDGTEQKLAAAPNPPTPTPPPPAPAAPEWKRPILGVNLESLKDYERQFMFIDVMKTSRTWGTPEKPYDGKGPMGRDGWPSGDFGTCVLTEQKNVNGIYKFSATGRCDITTPGSPAKIENLIYDPARNRTTADIVIAAPRDKMLTLNLAFRGTSGGLKDIKLLRPGYSEAANAQQVFTGEFLAALKPFDALRFMDYLRTNDNQNVRWDQRCKVEDAQYTGPRGAPFELAIELGNLMDKDIWLCVPALADDDFIRQLGALIREKLEPGRACYVEYSNEVWNGQFKQFKQNETAAKAEVAAGESTLNDGGRDTNVHYWGRKRIAKRSVEIKKLMGDDPRIRVVLASQVAYAPPGSLLKMQLEYVEKYHGSPSQFFYAVAGAPYFSPGRDETDPAKKKKKKWYTERPDVTVDGICERLLAKSGISCGENVQAFHKLAKKYGLKSFAYEGGLDLQQFNSNVPVKVASQYDLRTGGAIEDYLTKFYTGPADGSGGGDAMFYFTLTSRYTKNGYWGLTEDARELITPKYLAATRVAAKLREGGLPPAPGSPPQPAPAAPSPAPAAAVAP